MKLKNGFGTAAFIYLLGTTPAQTEYAAKAWDAMKLRHEKALAHVSAEKSDSLAYIIADLDAQIAVKNRELTKYFEDVAKSWIYILE